MSRSRAVLAELLQYTRYDPGKPLKDANKKEINGSTALAVNSVACFDPDPSAGGHFITRYGANDSIDNFRITHEEASHLLQHLKKFVVSNVSKNGKPDDKPTTSLDR